MAKRPKRKKPIAHQVPTIAPDAAVGAPQKLSWLDRDWLLGLILFVAVILAYSPVWWAGYIWDDPEHLTANPCIVGPLGLKEIWTTHAASICPLTFTAFWVEHALWGLNPLPYHLVNVLLHGLDAIVLWKVLLRLGIPGAWLGAALWALHPVQVESVAWITEMKNTQSCLFYLLSVLFFLKWLKAAQNNQPVGWNYGCTLLFAAMAMASKSSTVVLPVVLCLCAWWMGGRWKWRHLLFLVPIFVMSAAASGVTLWLGIVEPSLPGEQLVRSWPERIAGVGDVVGFYVGKLLWPHPLMTIYPRWQIDASQWVSYLSLLAVIVVFGTLWLKRGAWARPYFFALAYFLVVLLPFLGLIDQSFWRYSFVEDHLQYLACIGPLALAGAGMVRLAEFVFPGKRRLQSTLAAGVLLLLGVLSWQRAWAYENEESLWTDTLAKNPSCWVGHNQLGVALAQKGLLEQALAHFQQASEFHPNEVSTQNNLGLTFLQMGQLDEAQVHFQTALGINPSSDLAHYNLGLVLSRKGQVDEAMIQFQKALEINPIYAEPHDDMGNIFFQKRQVDRAIEQYQQALKINPNYADAHFNLGVAFSQKRQVNEAISEFQEALRLKPDDADTKANLAQAEEIARQNAGQK